MYSFFDAYLYKIKHPSVKIITRINECDERKGTHYMNKLLIDASSYSDYIVFIASWLKPLLEKQGLNKDIPSSVILNGSDEQIFNTQNKQLWNKKDKFNGFGIEFNIDNFEEKLRELYDSYDNLIINLKNYNNTFEKMSRQYYNLFQELHRQSASYQSNEINLRRLHYYYIKIYSLLYTRPFRFKKNWQKIIHKTKNIIKLD